MVTAGTRGRVDAESSRANSRRADRVDPAPNSDPYILVPLAGTLWRHFDRLELNTRPDRSRPTSMTHRYSNRRPGRRPPDNDTTNPIAVRGFIELTNTRSQQRSDLCRSQLPPGASPLLTGYTMFCGLVGWSNILFSSDRSAGDAGVPGGYDRNWAWGKAAEVVANAAVQQPAQSGVVAAAHYE